MRIGVMTVLYHGLELTEALDRIAALGVRSVELATGNYVGNAHADPVRLLADERALDALRQALDEREMTISALSQHGNPLHPDPCRWPASRTRCGGRPPVLASLLEVASVVNAFSGCPGDITDGARYPNWVTCTWPSDFTRGAGVAVEREGHPVLAGTRPRSPA